MDVGPRWVQISGAPPLRLLATVFLLLAAGCAASAERGRKEDSLAALEAKDRAAVEQVIAHAARRCATIRPTETTIGSGAVIAEDGWILTAQHVVRGHKTVEVILADGFAHEGRVIAENAGNDYALLKIDADGLEAFTLSSRRPVIGERVVAVGTGTKWAGSNASTGVVIYPRVRIPGEDGAYYYDAIFHSAPIYKGDSGGPLVDMKGELVGIHGGFASENASVAPAIAEIIKRLPNRGRLAGTAFAESDDPSAFPIPWPAQKPRDFAESAEWTLSSVEDTLVHVYAKGDRAGVREVLSEIRRRYLAARATDRRRDDELVRAMLGDVFRELESRQRARTPGAVATATPAATNQKQRRRGARRKARTQAAAVRVPRGGSLPWAGRVARARPHGPTGPRRAGGPSTTTPRSPATCLKRTGSRGTPPRS